MANRHVSPTLAMREVSCMYDLRELHDMHMRVCTMEGLLTAWQPRTGAVWMQQIAQGVLSAPAPWSS
jgi:hypothetical protein